MTSGLRADTPVPDPSFLADFQNVLVANKCDGLFGIDTVANETWSELKIGDASVVVPDNDSNDSDREKFIPVALAFDGEKPGFKVHGRCKKTHRHKSTPGGQ